VVGVSGGADSVALLHLLCEQNASGWALRLHVAHLNHQLRGAESEGDARFVGELAHSLRVPISSDSGDVTARAQRDGMSIEQAGRMCRFEFFERVCLQTGAELIALAHQADDQAETVLHRIVRGTGIRGLVGIRPSRPIRPGSAIRIIRPLLDMKRAEIEQYLRERGLAGREDSTNQSLAFTRNALRREVLPLLRDRFNPQIVDALIRLGEQAADLEEYLDDVADKSLPPLLIDLAADSLTLDCEALDRKPRVIRSHILRQAIRRLGLPEGDVTYDHMTRLLALAGDRSGSKSLHLPGGLRVTRAYGRLKLFRAPVEPLPADTDEEHVDSDGTTLLASKRLEFTVESFECNGDVQGPYLRQKKEADPSVYEEWLDADRIQLPLLARLRREGDRFCPLGMSGMKKVSDFLIDQKVAADQRDLTVLLCDQSGPIWVVPHRIDDRVRLREETRRVLRVTVRPILVDDNC
jgi:tRNA(Ile)-lysidine synthase